MTVSTFISKEKQYLQLYKRKFLLLNIGYLKIMTTKIQENAIDHVFYILISFGYFSKIQEMTKKGIIRNDSRNDKKKS